MCGLFERGEPRSGEISLVVIGIEMELEAITGHQLGHRSDVDRGIGVPQQKEESEEEVYL